MGEVLNQPNPVAGISFMKISDMTKDELVTYMRTVTHEIGLPDKRFRFDASSKSWERAFKLIRGSGYENLEMDCAKCVNKVNEWLLR